TRFDCDWSSDVCSSDLEPSNCYDDSIVSMTPALRAPVKAPFAYTSVIFFGLLILLCYAPAVRSLVDVWLHNDDMGHGFFVPAVRSEERRVGKEGGWWW